MKSAVLFCLLGLGFWGFAKGCALIVDDYREFAQCGPTREC
jgi:hypothetical protein